MMNHKFGKIILISMVSTLIVVGSLMFLKQDKHTHDLTDSGPREKREVKDPFTFEDTYNSKFQYKGISVDWTAGDEYIDRSSSAGIFKRNVTSGEEDILMPATDYDTSTASGYFVSADQKYILILTNYKKGWRHSFNGTYKVYDVDNKMFIDDLGDDIQYVRWSPVGNSLAYVKGFNIYYRATVTGVASEVQVTSDGGANHIYNGIPDWVYEEEMISSNNVMYFSPDGQHLAYAQFNDSQCKHIQFSRYDGNKYPLMIDVSYPKAGTTHPTNKVFVYSVADDAASQVKEPDEFNNEDYLFNRVTWADGSTFAVSWSNRAQNSGAMYMCVVATGGTTTCTTTKNDKHESSTGWLYQRRPYWIPVFGNTTEEYFTVRPSNNWQHLYRVDQLNTEVLTEGEYTVTSESASYPSVEHYDATNDYVYFSSTKESPQHRQIYRTKARGGVAEPDCATCKLMDEYPGRCNYISTSFSTDASHVIVRCSGDNLPPVYVQYRVDHSAVAENDILVDKMVLVDNQELVDTLENTDVSTKEYGKMTSTTGYDFTYQMFKPPNFDATKKYPMLLDIYAGPGYQRVYPTWSRSWQFRYVPSALDVVVVSVDTRGSNFYGEDFMHSVYRKLGQYEPIDQLEAVEYFSKMDFIDETRIAVWGWVSAVLVVAISIESYGGYSTSLVLGNDKDKLVRCGFAVAPLADWRFYDTIYAERYMGLPQDNGENYDKGSILNVAKNIRSGSYFLIHGTADDNVHFQNAARIEYSLVENDIYFNDFFYADQDHSINDGNANYHVDKVLTRQVCQCFNIPVPDDLWT